MLGNEASVVEDPLQPPKQTEPDCQVSDESEEEFLCDSSSDEDPEDPDIPTSSTTHTEHSFVVGRKSRVSGRIMHLP